MKNSLLVILSLLILGASCDDEVMYDETVQSECPAGQFKIKGICLPAIMPKININFGTGGVRGRKNCPSGCPRRTKCRDGRCVKSRFPFGRNALTCTAECMPGQQCVDGVCESIPI